MQSSSSCEGAARELKIRVCWRKGMTDVIYFFSSGVATFKQSCPWSVACVIFYCRNTKRGVTTKSHTSSTRSGSSAAKDHLKLSRSIGVWKTASMQRSCLRTSHCVPCKSKIGTNWVHASLWDSMQSNQPRRWRWDQWQNKYCQSDSRWRHIDVQSLLSTTCPQHWSW